MNHIYRVIFNRQTGTFQAVSEIAKSTQKTSKGKFAKAFKAFLTPISLAISLFFGLNAHAAPTGGQVVAGQAIINQADLSTNINQTSQNAVINWQSFNVANNETVNFNQPNAQATTLNRVIGNERSVIDGAMNASGKVFISNPNGMLIGKNAQINVGALVATTAKIKDQDFMNGLFKFDEATGTITQLGDIKVPKGGVVALIAPIVENKGKITAPQGKVLLASAEKFSITLPDNANFKYTLDQGTLQGLVDNGGAILADGGHIVLTARGTDAVKKSLIKHTGVAQANTVQNNKGVIELLGDLDNSKLEVVGSLKAEAKESGDGGFIETSASKVDIDKQAIISTNAENGKTGTWVLDPNDFVVAKTGGDLTGTEVAERLESTNIQLHTINSNDGKTTKGNGDIIINDDISWNKNTLTLKAHHDIHINANLNGTGTAKLALEYGQGTADGRYKAMVDGKETTLDNDYYLDQKTPVKDRTVKINLPEGKTFSTKKGSDGNTIVFDVIHKMPEIVKNGNGEWEGKFAAGRIAFGKDIDLSYTKNYKGFAGWTPDRKTTRINGLGHTLLNMSLDVDETSKVSSRTGVGLLNTYDFNPFSGTIEHLNMDNFDIRVKNTASSQIGALGGRHNSSFVDNVRANGAITVDIVAKNSGAIDTSNLQVGGLLGEMQDSDITNSSTEVDIRIKDNSAPRANPNLYVGGVVGHSLGHNSGDNLIQNTKSSGTIAVNYQNLVYSPWVHIGGVAGKLSNTKIFGGSFEGGIELNSANTRFDVGGLVGESRTSTIDNSYSKASIRAKGSNLSLGGLVGIARRDNNILNSYANGSIQTNTETESNAGGLVAKIDDVSNKVSNSYSTMRFTTSDKVHTGGLVGISADGSLNNLTSSYYDGTVADINALGDETNCNVSNSCNTNRKKSTNQLKTKSTFTGWDFDNVWRISEGSDINKGSDTPRLRALTKGVVVIAPTKTDLNIKAVDLSKVYDGIAVNTIDDLKKLKGWKDNEGHLDGIEIQGLKNGDKPADVLKGTLNFDGAKSTWKGAVDAGKYVLDPSGLNGGQDYEIVWKTGSLTIGKRPLNITLIGEKIYDASNVAKIDKNTKFTQTGLVESDVNKISLNGSVVLKNKDVGVQQAQSTKDFYLTGESVKNYELGSVQARWGILPQPVNMRVNAYAGTRHFEDEDFQIVSPIWSGDNIEVKGYADIQTTNSGSFLLRPNQYNLKIYGRGAENYRIGDILVNLKDSPSAPSFPGVPSTNNTSTNNTSTNNTSTNNTSTNNTSTNNRRNPVISRQDYSDKTLPFMDSVRTHFVIDTVPFDCELRGGCIDVDNMKIHSIPKGWSNHLVGKKLEDFKQGSAIFERRHPDLFVREELANTAIDMRSAVDNADDYIDSLTSNISDDLTFSVSDGLLYKKEPLKIKEYITNMMKRNYKQNAFESSNYLESKFNDLANYYVQPKTPAEARIQNAFDTAVGAWNEAQTEKGKFGVAGYISDGLGTADSVIKVGLAWADVSTGVSELKDMFDDPAKFDASYDQIDFVAAHTKDFVELASKVGDVAISASKADFGSASNNTIAATTSLANLVTKYVDWENQKKSTARGLAESADGLGKAKDLLEKIDKLNEINKQIKEINSLPSELLIKNDKDIIAIVLRTQQIALGAQVVSDGLALLKDATGSELIGKIADPAGALAVTATEAMDFAVKSVSKEFDERNNWIKIDEDNQRLDRALIHRSGAVKDLLIHTGETAVSSRDVKNLTTTRIRR